MTQTLAPEEILIERGANARRYWRDTWRLRGLLLHLARRDIVVRYKQTFMGVAWALVRPFMSMVVFTLVFGKVARLPTEGDTPYPLLVYAGLLPWQLFASTLSRSTTSMVGNRQLISRIYFPRVLLLLNASVVALVDFLIAFAFLVVLMIGFDALPDWRVLTLPLFISLASLTALGLGLWLSALNVRYRDFAYLVPYLLQLGMFISPVGFSSAVVPEGWRLAYSLNPLVGVVDGCRWALLGGGTPLYLPGLLASVAFAALLVFSGLWYFRRQEATFADRL